MSKVKKVSIVKKKEMEDSLEKEEIVNNELEQEEEEESEEEEDDDDSSEEEEDDDSQLHIDINQNKIYQGLCTLFEDEEGNNILQYINLLHTELIDINSSLKNLSSMSNSLEIIAKSLKNKKSDK